MRLPPATAPAGRLLPPLRAPAPRRRAEKLMVVLRDGRKIIGTLRTFDQFSNVVLEHALERVIVGKRFADVPLGLYVIRGENVVLLGQIVRAPAPSTRRARAASASACATTADASAPATLFLDTLPRRPPQDDDKERETTEGLLERVGVDEILELKQEREEDDRLRAGVSRALRKPTEWDD